MTEQRGDPNDMYWRVERVVVGHGFGMHPKDDRMSDTVFMDLHCEDLAKPGRFTLRPDDAEQLARMLLDSADRARRTDG